MTPEQWHQIKDKLHGALEMEPARRFAYAAELSAVHPELKQDIESLLACHDGMSTDFLNLETGTESSSHSAKARAVFLGRQFGPYRVVEQIGSGGMGEVFRAVRADDQ